MKIQFTILLFFILSVYSFGSPTTKTNQVDPKNIVSATAPNDQMSSGAIAIGSQTDKVDDRLNSILKYTIVIFFSILIVILIQNRNLEKRYKKLLLDFNNKDRTKNS